MTRSHFIEILMILTKYVFDLGVRLTDFSVTLRFYCMAKRQQREQVHKFDNVSDICKLSPNAQIQYME